LVQAVIAHTLVVPLCGGKCAMYGIDPSGSHPASGIAQAMIGAET
jgi:hypothetical protein